jgi:hypothetical protein
MTLLVLLLCLIAIGIEVYQIVVGRRASSDAGRISGLEAARAGLEERLAAAERLVREQDTTIAALREEQAFLPKLADGVSRLEEGGGRQEVRLRVLEERDNSAALHEQVVQIEHLARALETNVSALRDQTRELVTRLDTTEQSTAHRLAALQQDTERLQDRLDDLPLAVSTAVQTTTTDLSAALESMENTVGRLHTRMQEQLDHEVVRTLGGEPLDSGTLLGALSGDITPLEDTLLLLYAGLLDQHGLRIRLQVTEPEGVRYYLATTTGRGPVELEWEFLSLLDDLRSVSRPDAPSPEMAALRSLLVAMNTLDKGFVQLGPLVVVRTPESLLCGVLSVGESRCFDTERMLADIDAAAGRLQALPASRFHDLTDLPEPE